MVGEVRASTRGNFPPEFGVPFENGTSFFPNLKRDDCIGVLYSSTSVYSHPKELGCHQAQIHKTLLEYTLSHTAQQCVRESCTAIETVELCFLSCPALNEMWRSLWAPWSEISSAALDWWLPLFLKPSDLKLEWRLGHKTLLVLWRVHTAIVFHAMGTPK
ncbi:hypothetical protein P3T76_012879 [Phytophthora citrophthora]|uniref:Uncharacterized protein n=1 Tax=Phytophthora citrophthora TaxID=4793 RepID=A0AAD9LCN1_9STRA|nr:hypothetical protein P3T76_012879 [Phytophthora citrophthora]